MLKLAVPKPRALSRVYMFNNTLTDESAGLHIIRWFKYNTPVYKCVPDQL
jgi:hypothetical protein